MAKRMLIDATHSEETRAVVVSGNRLEEFDFESSTKTQLKGNIYLAKVTRVEPSLQAAFINYGGNRHGFLAFSEIHPDYYRIPVADREALLAEVSSQQDDIDIDDHGVEEIDDNDAGMDTTSPHDEDVAANGRDETHETDAKATADDSDDRGDDGESVEPQPDVADEDNEDGQEDVSGDASDDHVDASKNQENEAGATVAASDGSDDTGDDTADNFDASSDAGSEVARKVDGEGDEGSDDKSDEKSDDKGPSHATLGQDDIVVTGTTPEDDEDSEGTGDTTKEPTDSDDSEGIGADDIGAAVASASGKKHDLSAGDPELTAGDESAAGANSADAADIATGPETGRTTGRTTAGDADLGTSGATEGEEDGEAPETPLETREDDNEATSTPAQSRESGRAPSGRRRRSRGCRDRNVESVGGEDVDDFERSKAWHRRYRIQEVISRRQILLVQVAKEERGNKGAALTTYISLAGRYCVLMPNTPRGGGISRKIANATDRRKLKDIVGGLNIPTGMAVIVRTAGAQRTKAEIRRDYEYLLKLWDEIRERTLQSTAPSLIHEEANLIKRSIRDLYSKDIDEVLVEGDEGYKIAKSFMRLLMPSHAKRVKAYKEEGMPLFHRYQVEAQIDNIYSPTVQLNSGGYIVLNATEALVAIDVNSGRATRERNIEETAYRTNLEAADEIARQLRLRDLAGLIVIDFIDMEEGRNRYNVERRLKEAMKHDRARIQLGRISAFGLLEMSRQRLRPSIAEISAQPCPTCHGSGVVRSIESSALQILRAIEEEGMRQRAGTLTITMPSEVAFYIMNHKRPALAEVEGRYELSVFIRGDDNLVPPDHRIEAGEADEESEAAPTRTQKHSSEGDDAERGRKRRGRRRRGRSDEDDAKTTEAQDRDAGEVENTRDESDGNAKDERRGSRRRGRRGGRKRTRKSETGPEARSEEAATEVGAPAEEPADTGDETAPVEADTDAGKDAPAPRRRRRRRTPSRTQPKESPSADVDSGRSNGDGAQQSPAPAADPEPAAPQVAAMTETAAASSPPAANADTDQSQGQDASDAAVAPPEPDSKPGRRRGGWWSFSRNGS